MTRQTSTEGMVLLKNDMFNGKAVLPMEGIKRVALFGVNSYDFMSGGLGSGCVNVPYVVDMVDGLKNAGVSTTPQLTDIYTKYVAYAKSKLKADKNPWMWFLDQGQRSTSPSVVWSMRLPRLTLPSSPLGARPVRAWTATSRASSTSPRRRSR